VLKKNIKADSMNKTGKFFFKARGFTPVPFLAIVVAFARPTPASILWGLALTMLGEFFRIWGVGYAGQATRTRNVGAGMLVTNGPYAYMRNPLYFGNFILTSGAVAALNALMPWALLAYCVLFWIQYYFIIRLEEETLQAKFGNVYADYTAAVPRFWPALRPYGSPSAVKFNLSLALRNEINTLASIAIIIVLALCLFWFGNPFPAWIKYLLSG
jgi:protein-S-isoprenylcysteine O-methyltransferase Ste14